MHIAYAYALVFTSLGAVNGRPYYYYYSMIFASTITVRVCDLFHVLGHIRDLGHIFLYGCMMTTTLERPARHPPIQPAPLQLSIILLDFVTVWSGFVDLPNKRGSTKQEHVNLWI